jgi:flagellar capping protein FliD
MKRQLLALSLIALLATPVISRAQVAAAPPLMNFSGRLAKPDGTPVPDGTYSVRFYLWTAASGGTEKWNQTLHPVAVRNGTFAVLLNANTANLFDSDLYLEIKIGTDAPLTPRQRLASVAYAMKANTVPDNSITNAKIVNVNWNKIANPPHTLLTLPFNGSANSPNPAFKVTNQNGFGLFGETVGPGAAGVYGRATDPTSVGGSFLSTTGNALIGSATGSQGSGVTGTAANAVHSGGYFSNTVGNGLIGRSDGSGYGVYGVSETGYGGAFISNSGPVSLFAESTTLNGKGIQGIADNGYPASDQVYGNFISAIGVYGRSQNGCGIKGESEEGYGIAGLSTNWIGVFGKSPRGIGVYGISTVASGVVGDSRDGTGVYASSINGDGVYSVSFGDGFAGRFIGTVMAYSYQTASDARYKTNVHTFPNALDTLLNLRGVTYDWKREEFKDKHFKAGKQIGFIAQEVEKVLPELVHTDRDGYKSVAYVNVVPVLVEAIKQQQQQIATQQQQIEALKQQSATLKKQYETAQDRKETEIAELKARYTALEATLASVLQRLERLETSRQ